LEILARITSFIILLVFALVNLALILLKRQDPCPPGVSVYPNWLPGLALILALLLLGFEVTARWF